MRSTVLSRVEILSEREEDLLLACDYGPCMALPGHGSKYCPGLETVMNSNYRAAPDAGRGIYFHIWRHWPGPCERGCYE
jgi:hypothetical protein